MSFPFNLSKCENNSLTVGGTSWSFQETARENKIKKWNHHITIFYKFHAQRLEPNLEVFVGNKF